MALSAADKKWIRETVRKVLAEVIAAEAGTQGGYDGATEVPEEYDGEEGKGKRKRRTIGFRVNGK